LKEKVEETTKNINIFELVGMDEMDEMEQRNIVLFLRLKVLSKKAIHHELVAMLQENAVSHSSVMRFHSAERRFSV
jgi:hypothetical protein